MSEEFTPPRDRLGRFKPWSLQDRLRSGKPVPAEVVRDLVFEAFIAGINDRSMISTTTKKAERHMKQVFGD